MRSSRYGTPEHRHCRHRKRGECRVTVATRRGSPGYRRACGGSPQHSWPSVSSGLQSTACTWFRAGGVRLSRLEPQPMGFREFCLRSNTCETVGQGYEVYAQGTGTPWKVGKGAETEYSYVLLSPTPAPTITSPTRL